MKGVTLNIASFSKRHLLAKGHGGVIPLGLWLYNLPFRFTTVSAAAHHIQASPRAPSVCAATVVEAGAQGTDEAVTSVHGASAKFAVWAEAALPRSSSEATPCNDWRFRSARAAAAASWLKPQGLSTTWRR
jgi:hypothetical protein